MIPPGFYKASINPKDFKNPGSIFNYELLAEFNSENFHPPAYLLPCSRELFIPPACRDFII